MKEKTMSKNQEHHRKGLDVAKPVPSYVFHYCLFFYPHPKDVHRLLVFILYHRQLNQTRTRIIYSTMLTSLPQIDHTTYYQTLRVRIKSCAYFFILICY